MVELAPIDPKLQPPWSQTGKAHREVGPCVYSDRNPPGQRIIGQTDEGTEVSVPHLPYINMMDPAGNVCAVPIGTNRDLLELDEKYRRVTLAIRARKGWVVWDYDSQLHPKFTQAEWEAERERLRAQRAAKRAKEAAKFKNLDQERLNKVIEAANASVESGAATTKLLSQILDRLTRADLAGAEKLVAKAGGGKKKDDGGE